MTDQKYWLLEECKPGINVKGIRYGLEALTDSLADASFAESIIVAEELSVAVARQSSATTAKSPRPSAVTYDMPDLTGSSFYIVEESSTYHRDYPEVDWKAESFDNGKAALDALVKKWPIKQCGRTVHLLRPVKIATAYKVTMQ